MDTFIRDADVHADRIRAGETLEGAIIGRLGFEGTGCFALGAALARDRTIATCRSWLMQRIARKLSRMMKRCWIVFIR
jgi:hypothetical protein